MSERPLIASFDRLSAHMREVADDMRAAASAELPMTRHRLLMHAGELCGAAGMLDDWSREIKRETGQ